tara:strand:- start:89372 stop:89632 length:261 start_codon:yes stop_codon:yes gene_type:complete
MNEHIDKPVKEFTYEEFIATLEESQKKALLHLKEREIIAKQNRKDLIKRSKELGKEIPLELLFIATSTQIHYVGSDFMKKYKEWIE